MYNARKIFRQLNVNLTMIGLWIFLWVKNQDVTVLVNSVIPQTGEKLPSPYLVENFFLTNNPN